MYGFRYIHLMSLCVVSNLRIKSTINELFVIQLGLLLKNSTLIKSWITVISRIPARRSVQTDFVVLV